MTILKDKSADECYNLGIQYCAEGNFDLSINECTQAIQLCPLDSEAYFCRGNAYFFLKNYKSAIADYDKAIELDKNSDAYFNRAIAHVFLGKPDLALEDYEEMLLEKSPDTYKDDDEIKRAFFFASNLALNIKKYDKAREFIKYSFLCISDKEQQYKDAYLKIIKTTEDSNKNIEEKNRLLQEKELEIEDMMSMFAHKFRSPLDAIIYNTTHENQVKLYTESANTMRGLLDIFSIISADDKILTDKIKNDNKGNATLMSILNKNLNMILLHLLSASGMSKIHQHYMNYAKAQGKITDAVSYKEWCDDYFEMEGELQKQWEQEFSALLNQSASLAERLQWLEHYFFKLDIIGFEIESIQFKEYETTESFLFILMNEILVNAFKYYASENKQPVVLEWTSTENDQILSCRNPSIRRERDQHKGSGKGHTFLSALARKTGCKFTKPKPQDDFLLEFAIPNQLLLSNLGTEK